MGSALLGVLLNVEYWHWFALASILLLVELLTGGGYLFWIAISAVIVGLFVWIIPEVAWGYQLLIFGAGAILLAFGWYYHLVKNPGFSDHPQLNRRNEQYIGRIFTLAQPIVNGYGMIRVDDSQWRVSCNDDLPQGANVRITAADGVILHAEKVND